MQHYVLVDVFFSAAFKFSWLCEILKQQQNVTGRLDNTMLCSQVYARPIINLLFSLLACCSAGTAITPKWVTKLLGVGSIFYASSQVDLPITYDQLILLLLHSIENCMQHNYYRQAFFASSFFLHAKNTLSVVLQWVDIDPTVKFTWLYENVGI